MNEESQLSLGFEPPKAEMKIAGVSLREARRIGLFSALDFEFATRLAALYGEARPALIWAAALVCRQESQGHVCADLSRLAAEGLIAEEEGEIRFHSALPEGLALGAWEEMLRASPLVGTEDSTSEDAVSPTPLILDDHDRLYLRRSWDDQRSVADWLSERTRQADFDSDAEQLEAAVGPLDPDAPADPARLALQMGLQRSLSIVTGGPGTGKTTLVARLIALLIREALARGETPPLVRLLAPTGKAAAAMTASFVRQRESLGLSGEAERAIPQSAETIHRALLPRSRRDAFGRQQDFRMPGDVIVVDEASMVDLRLMRGLFESAAPEARVILLGDPDQLASVSSGAVLSELCEAADALPAFARSRVHLEHSHRFASGGAIGLLADAIRKGDADAAIDLLRSDEHPEVSLRVVDSVPAVRAHLAETAREMQRGILAASDPGEKLARLASCRVLCAHRQGALGSEALCEALDAAAASVRETTSRSGWWRGRLLLVTRNAPEQDLWNGDVGLVEEVENGLRAIFPDSAGGVRTLSAGRLPAFESAIAMSVHKSQGSEFDRVELVLGAVASGLMTRELLYTGVTRAREQLCIHASEEAIRTALARRVERDSGLVERLVAEG